MKRLSEETLRKYVDFCDSGRPWYFCLLYTSDAADE